MNYYISDTHFGYQKIAEQSGFTDTEAYNEAVIRRINLRVADGDTLFLLGDLSCYQQDPSEFIERLNGMKILITGNHDTRWIKHRHVRKLFSGIHSYLLVRDAGTKIFLCHYPMAEWDGTFKGYWHFYGHIHNEKGIGAERIMRYVPRAVNVSIQKIGWPKTAEELFEIRRSEEEKMSKYCPIVQRPVLYLDCIECEEKICKEKEAKGQWNQPKSSGGSEQSSGA